MTVRSDQTISCALPKQQAEIQTLMLQIADKQSKREPNGEAGKTVWQHTVEIQTHCAG